MIELINVSKQYASGVTVLSNISFTAQAGRMLFITGHSGAGKSTLLRLLALLERPSTGQILVNGQPIHNMPKKAVPYYRQQIGVVFQDHQLLMDRSVFDNLALPLWIANYSAVEVARRVRAILDKVGLLAYERALPIQLSGGQQQRVGIARAMVNRPPILLADEPTGNLDPQLSQDILGLFEQFAQLGTCVLVASHDLALISRFRSPVLQLSAGRLHSSSDYPANSQTPQNAQALAMDQQEMVQ